MLCNIDLESHFALSLYVFYTHVDIIWLPPERTDAQPESNETLMLIFEKLLETWRHKHVQVAEKAEPKSQGFVNIRTHLTKVIFFINLSSWTSSESIFCVHWSTRCHRALQLIILHFLADFPLKFKDSDHQKNCQYSAKGSETRDR